VRRGEIVGIAGVEGNGQSELLQAMLHPREPLCRTSGTVRFLGEDVTQWDARRIRDLGVAVIPEDRQREGLLLERPVSENFLLGLQRSSAFSHAGLLNAKNLLQAPRRRRGRIRRAPAGSDDSGGKPFRRQPAKADRGARIPEEAARGDCRPADARGGRGRD
jgi:ABC-type uncharacterized transport system ATPase subunit